MAENNLLQVSTVHYNFSSYVDKGRWCSYWHQIDEILKVNPRRLLLIGVGDNIIPSLLYHICPEMEVVTFDFDPALKPTVVGDLRWVIQSFSNVEPFDCVVCFQVLEHLPFENFEPILAQLSALGKHVVISLPHRNFCFHIKVDFPWIHLDWTKLVPLFWEKNFEFNGEHYWELGTKGCSLSIIRQILNKYFVIKNEFSVREYLYHRFYILDLKRLPSP